MIALNELALWGTFLSGLGALAALIIALVQIRSNAKSQEAAFWLSLREHFSHPNRMLVHQDLRNGRWVVESPDDLEYWTKVEDYMGLLEVCEGMLQQKILNEKIFKCLYEYRVFNILFNSELAKTKLICEYQDWKTFYSLLGRLYGDGWNNLYDFLNLRKFDYDELQSEADFINKLSREERLKYDSLKSCINLK